MCRFSGIAYHLYNKHTHITRKYFRKSFVMYFTTIFMSFPANNIVNKSKLSRWIWFDSECFAIQSKFCHHYAVSLGISHYIFRLLFFCWCVVKLHRNILSPFGFLNHSIWHQILLLRCRGRENKSANSHVCFWHNRNIINDKY